LKLLRVFAIVSSLLCSLQALSAQKEEGLSGKLKGTVVEVDSGTPLQDVLVAINARPRIEVRTDAQGQFEIPSVPVGKQRVTAAKDGFAIGRPAGHNAPGSFEVWVSVRSHETEDMVLKMVRTGVISGRVVDTSGRPIRASIALGRLTYDRDGKVVVKAISDSRGSVGRSTNDQGEYRRFDLEPGEYYVLASPPPDTNTFASGAVFATTYYPGTTDPLKATKVQVASTQEVRLSDIVVDRASGARLSLQFEDTTDKFLYINQPELGPVPALIPFRDGGQITFPSFPSGRYEFLVMNGFPGVGGSLSKGARSAHIVVDMVGTTVKENVILYEGLRVTGRIVSENEDGVRSAIVDARVTLQPKSAGITPSAMSGKDGVFSFENTPKGRYDIQLSNLPFGAYLGTATLDSTSMLAGGDLVSDGIIEVIVGLDGATIQGMVSDSDDNNVVSSVVALIPEEASRREAPVFFRTAVTDLNGRFELSSIAPGSYQIYSWRELEGAAYRNAEFMKRFEGRGRLITVGKRQKLEIRLVAQ